MANGWTLKRRLKQSQGIQRWRPWERSTGPRTQEGKARSSRNRDKGDARGMLRAIRNVLRECDAKLIVAEGRE